MADPCDKAVEKADEAFDMARTAHTLAIVNEARHVAHENECGRRYEDWRRASDSTREQINGVIRSVSKFTSDVQSSVSAANSTTDEKINGLYRMFIGGQAALLLCFIGAILAYVFTHK